MENIDQKLEDLENTINNADEKISQTANMPDKTVSKNQSVKTPLCVKYVYLIAGFVPILSIVAFYYSKPKFVVKKVKGKTVICWKNVFKYTAIITGIAVVGAITADHYGVLKGKSFCFGKK